MISSPAVVLKPKTFAGAGGGSPDACCSRLEQHADDVAHIGAGGIGAEEISDHNFVWWHPRRRSEGPPWY